jgi:fructoselysine-6-phosphate deglycase
MSETEEDRMTSSVANNDFAEALVLDEAAYLDSARRAVAIKALIKEVAFRAHEAGVGRVAFVGAGGTYANTLWLSEFARLSSTLPADSFVAAELVASQDPRIREDTLVVVNSVTGTTEDVIEAVEFCKSRGARVVVFTPEADSPLAHAATWYVPTEGSFRGFEIYLLVLTAGLLHLRGELNFFENRSRLTETSFVHFDRLYDELDALPAAMLEVVKTTEPLAAAFASEHARSDYMFIIGSGFQWGLAYNYSMCVIEEAFWVRTTRVSGAEFFHGSLELIEKDTAVLVLQGEDYSRAIDDRAIAFSRRYSNDVTVVDSATYALKGVSDDIRPLLSNVVLNHATRRISLHLQAARNQGLDSRKYYRKVAY